MAISALLIGGAAGAAVVARGVLPAEGAAPVGVRLDGETLAAGDPEALVAARAAAVLGRKVTVRHDGAIVLETTVAALGGRVDEERAVAALRALGHEGGWLERFDDSWQARARRLEVALPVELPVEPLYQAVAEFKEQLDRKPTAARWDFTAQTATPHQDGLLADVYALSEAIRGAAHAGDVDVALPVVRTEPLATQNVVRSIDASKVVAFFETRFAFAGNQAGRATNVQRAAGGVDGLVMMPSEVVSFNELVGPRSTDNGFAEAGEIYKGEMRMGIGGGTCQVASTFHAAAFFGGLDVVERSPHSRPSGYIGIGLDATVAYPHVDLKLRNPHAFPVIIKAVIVDGGGTLRVEVLGREDIADVDYAAATVGIKPYSRKVREAYWLPPGEVRRSQAGRQGVTIEKIRTIHFADGQSRVEKTRDHYPPTQEVYFVPAGSNPDELLPPLPDQSG